MCGSQHVRNQKCYSAEGITKYFVKERLVYAVEQIVPIKLLNKHRIDGVHPYLLYRTCLPHHATPSGVHATLRNHSSATSERQWQRQIPTCCRCARRLRLVIQGSVRPVLCVRLHFVTSSFSSGAADNHRKPTRDAPSLKVHVSRSTTSKFAQATPALLVSRSIVSSEAASVLRSCDAVLSNRKRTRQRTKTDEDKRPTDENEL